MNADEISLCNATSPPSRRPDLHPLALVLKCIASGHYNKIKVVGPNFSKMARQNFIIFSQWMQNNFSIALKLVRHRAALNYVLAQRMNIILQQKAFKFLSLATCGAWVFSSNIFQNRLVRIEKNFAPWQQIKLPVQCHESDNMPPWLKLIGTNGNMKR